MDLPDAITVALIGAVGGFLGGLGGALISFRIELSKLRSEERRWRLGGRPEARFAALERLQQAVVKQLAALVDLQSVTPGHVGRAEETWRVVNEAWKEVLLAASGAEPWVEQGLLDEIASLDKATYQWWIAVMGPADGRSEELEAARNEAAGLVGKVTTQLAQLLNPPELEGFGGKLKVKN